MCDTVGSSRLLACDTVYQYRHAIITVQVLTQCEDTSASNLANYVLATYGTYIL
jgi:hypothetical protein